MSLLGDILDAKAREVRALEAQKAPAATTVARDVAAQLRRRKSGPLHLLCEHKRKSPSAGDLSRTLSLTERCLRYARGGASMISVLTDATFFGGRFEDLSEVRHALDAEGFTTPLLAKEFIVSPVQLEHARGHGADAALLIARILPGASLGELVDASLALGLTPIVEVVTPDELERALGTRARILGVNARDLDTLEMSPTRARDVLSNIPATHVACHFSGLRDAASVRAVAGGRADAALLGEALMRQDDPSALHASLMAAARG